MKKSQTLDNDHSSASRNLDRICGKRRRIGIYSPARTVKMVKKKKKKRTEQEEGVAKNGEKGRKDGAERLAQVVSRDSTERKEEKKNNNTKALAVRLTPL